MAGGESIPANVKTDTEITRDVAGKGTIIGRRGTTIEITITEATGATTASIGMKVNGGTEIIATASAVTVRDLPGNAVTVVTIGTNGGAITTIEIEITIETGRLEVGVEEAGTITTTEEEGTITT